MDQYIQIVHTHAGYIAGGTKYNTSLNPQVTECELTEHIHYSDVNGPIIATIEVTDDSQKTRIFNKLDWQFRQDYVMTYGYDGTITDAFVRIVIDGVEIDMQEAWDYGSEYYGEWQLSVGRHTVEYYLRDPVQLNTYDNWDGPSYILFDWCNDIVEMTIPYGCRIIGGDSLRGQEGLTTIHIPETVHTIGYDGIAFCYALTSVNLPSNLRVIEGQAFYSAPFTSITLPDSLQTIGEQAFHSCKNLVSITIPKNVYHIDITRTVSSAYMTQHYYDHPFMYCQSLENIAVDPQNMVYYSPDGCNAIINRNDMTMICGCMNTTIPYGVRVIWDRAFEGVIGLQDITIPDTVVQIRSRAFFGCESLHSLTIPASVTSLGIDAFNTLTNSPWYPNGQDAFKDGITILSITPPTIDIRTFGDTNANSYTTYPIYVLAQSLQAYKAAWPQYASRIQAIP